MYCNKCKVEVTTNTDECPLCKHPLVKSNTDTFESYPTLKSYHQNKKIAIKIISFIFILASIICGYINYVTYSGRLWSLIVICCCMFSLFIFKWSFKPGFKLNKYILYNSIGISIFLILLDVTTDKITNFRVPTWSIYYTLPIILFAGLLLSLILMMSTRKLFQKFYLTVFTFCVLISLLLILIPFVPVKWAIFAAFGLVIATLLLIIIFYMDRVKEEITKKFHY